MPILFPTCDNPDELLAWPATEGPVNRIQIERSDTGGGAGYANIGSVTITAATRKYTYYDAGGDTADWYRWYFSNAGNTFPISANRAYSTEQQAGPEEGSGQLTSLYDVKQRLFGSDADSVTNEDENLASFIRQVSFKLQNKLGRRFARTPSSGETTYYFDVERTGRELRIPAGIASMSVLEVATSSQPASGGTFTTVAAADWFLRPLTAERDFGWPATRVVISDLSGSQFYRGYNTVRATMALGWAFVPDDIAKLAEDLVVEAHRSRGTEGGASFTVNLDGSRTFQMANDRGLIDHYRVIPVSQIPVG